MTYRRIVALFLTTVLSLALAAPDARSQAPSINVQPSHPSDTQTTFCITVTPASGEVRDFHVLPWDPDRHKSGDRRRPKPGTVSNLPSGWKVAQNSSKGISIHLPQGAQGLPATPQNPLHFCLTYSHAKGQSPPTAELLGIATNDGEPVPSTTDPPTGGQGTPSDWNFWGPHGPTAGPFLPYFALDFRDPSSITATIGSEIALTLTTTVADHVFRIHTSTVLSQSEGGPDDPLGIGIDTNSPIPAEWGVEIQPLRGLFRTSPLGDHVATVTVSLPDDPDLAGTPFYLAATLDLDGDGLHDLVSQIVEITPKPPGSTSGGVRFVVPYGG